MSNKPTSRTFAPSGSSAPRKAQSQQRRPHPRANAPVAKPHRVISSGPRPAEIRRRRRRTLKLLYLALGVEILAALLTSPALTVQSVHVRGLETLPEAEREQTLQALNLPRATNLLRVPFRSLRREANALPWVENARVPHSWGREVTVTVTPRAPLFALKVGTQWYETDKARVPIRLARASVFSRLPKVIYQQEIIVQPGFPINDTALDGAIHILQMLPQGSLADGATSGVQIAKIVIDQSDNLCLNMRDGMEFKFGQADDLATKTALVKRIYGKDPGIGQMLASINLSSPSAPACTPRAVTVSSLLPGTLPLPGNVTP